MRFIELNITVLSKINYDFHFKSAVYHMGNLKNITQTLAEKHELNEAAMPFRDDTFVLADGAVKYDNKIHETASLMTYMK